MWQPIETAPNNVLDVLVKTWDAGLDKFFYRRICDCVLQGGEVYAGPEGKKLTDCGLKPTHWMHIPDMPPELKE